MTKPGDEDRPAREPRRAPAACSVSTDISRPSLPCRAGAWARSARRAGHRSRGSRGASPARRRAGGRRSGTAAPSRRRSGAGRGAARSSRSRIRAHGTVTAGAAAPGAPIDSAMPTSRPAWSTTGPPETSGTSGESSGMPALGSGSSAARRRDGGHADRDARSAEAGASWRRPIERSSWSRRSRPSGAAGSAASPGMRGCSSSSARSSQGARATIRPCRTPRPVESLQRPRAPDAVGGGQHEPAVAVDDEARAEHVVARRSARSPRPRRGRAARPRTAARGLRPRRRIRVIATAAQPSAAAVQTLTPNRSIAAILCRVRSAEQGVVRVQV